MDFQEGDRVVLRVVKQTDLGYSVLIENEWEGLLFQNEIFQDIEEGMELDGYIKNIREDEKIDVSLRPQGFRNVIDSDADKILQKLVANKDGVILLTDKSSPDAIKFQLQLSKKAFKKAVGKLYREQKITIESDKIVLIKK